MRNLTVSILVTLAVLLGSMGETYIYSKIYFSLRKISCLGRIRFYVLGIKMERVAIIPKNRAPMERTTDAET